MKRRRNGFQSTLVRRPFKRPRRTVTRRRRRRPRTSYNPRIGGFLGIELKFYDQSAGENLTAPTDASGGEENPSATITLNTVIQGDGESNRDGRQIVMKKISVVGCVRQALQTNQTATENAPLVLIALVHDTQTNGALLNSENVFVNPSADAELATKPFRNLQFIKRFRVLKRLQLKLQQPTVVWDGTNIEQGGLFTPFKMHVPLNIPVNYSGTSETIANTVDNSLHIIAYCNDTSTVPRLLYNSRLRFVG